VVAVLRTRVYQLVDQSLDAAETTVGNRLGLPDDGRLDDVEAEGTTAAAAVGPLHNRDKAH
jgi:hypothetical protein